MVGTSYIQRLAKYLRTYLQDSDFNKEKLVEALPMESLGLVKYHQNQEEIIPLQERTSVLTMNQSMRTTGTLEISVRSIFNEPIFNSLVEELLTILKQTAKDENYAQIYSATEEYLLNALEIEMPGQARNPKTQDRLLESVDPKEKSHSRKSILIRALTRLHKHYVQTTESHYAYNPNVRPNPQAVFYPDPTRGKSLYDELPFAQTFSILNLDTPISAGGACTTAIAKFLHDNGFNFYSLHQDNSFNISLNDNSLSPFIFGQILKFAFGISGLPNFLSQVFAEEEIEAQRLELRTLLTKVKVFFLALDSAKVYFSKEKLTHSDQLLTIEENRQELEAVLNIWRVFNPDIKLIIAVSPVPIDSNPLTGEEHIVTLSSHVKAILRVAVEDFAKANSNSVYYFPAFDAVMYSVEKPLSEQRRQISLESEIKLIKLFEQMYLAKTV